MNNRINPLYIIILLLVMIFVSYSLLIKEKNNSFENNKQLVKTLKKVDEYNEYKQNWYNKKKVLSELNLILSNRVFKNQKQLKVQNKNAIKVKLESNNSKVLSNFLNKILNKRFLINNLELNKKFVLVEIGFK